MPPPPDGGHSSHRGTFYETLTAAINDMVANGFDSQERLDFWMKEIRKSAEQIMASPQRVAEMMRGAMQAIYGRLVEKQGILKTHAGVSRFTIERVAPQLRAELDRRVLASANLIKLNRQQAIEKTLQRFSGWSTSIPAGGTQVAKCGEIKTDIRKALAQLPFEERRVAIDQGHKFVASLNDILASDGGAIAAVWNSHWREIGYNYRPNHKKLDQKILLIRGNWAQQGGLVKAGDGGYVDDVERPAELPFCRCFYRYIYNLRDLPDDMLTAKGRAELAKVRIKV